jgi:hypothetical protein
VRHFVKLGLTTVILSGCLSSPGIKEPEVTLCDVIDGVDAECYLSTNPSQISDRKVNTFIGWTCVSPKDNAAIDSHHTIMHRELNEKSK